MQTDDPSVAGEKRHVVSNGIPTLGSDEKLLASPQQSWSTTADIQQVSKRTGRNPPRHAVVGAMRQEKWIEVGNLGGGRRGNAM